MVARTVQAEDQRIGMVAVAADAECNIRDLLAFARYESFLHLKLLTVLIDR